jgi:hypothetical protein
VDRSQRRSACAGVALPDGRARFAAVGSDAAAGRDAGDRRGMSIQRVQRKNGVVWAVRWRDASGRQRSRVFDRKRDAVIFEAEVKRRARLGDLAAMDAGREVLDDYVTRTWGPSHAAHLAPRTRQTYASTYDGNIAPKRRRAVARDRRRAGRGLPGQAGPCRCRAPCDPQGDDAARGRSCSGRPRGAGSRTTRSAWSGVRRCRWRTRFVRWRRSRSSGCERPLRVSGRRRSCPCSDTPDCVRATCASSAGAMCAVELCS